MLTKATSISMFTNDKFVFTLIAGNVMELELNCGQHLHVPKM